MSSNRLNRTIDAQFNIIGSSPQGQDLGLILCLGDDSEFPQYDASTKPKGFKATEKFRYYGDVSSMADDGFLSTSAIYKLANTVFTQKVIPQIIVARKLVGESYTDVLNAIINKNSKWFGLLATTTIKADILEIASFAETNRKLYSAGTSDSECLDNTTTDDIMSELKALSYEFTVCSYHTDIANNRINAGILARFLGATAGSNIAKFQTLIGCVVDDIGTNGEMTLENKYGNYYTDLAGMSCYSDGFTASGKRMDLIRDREWLRQTAQLRLVALLKNYSDRNEKIPYSDNGFAIIVTSVLIPLFVEAKTMNIIRKATLDELAIEIGVPVAQIDYFYPAYGFALFVPKVASIDSSIRATRKLTGFKFSGNVAGAVESIGILGNLFI